MICGGCAPQLRRLTANCLHGGPVLVRQALHVLDCRLQSCLLISEAATLNGQGVSYRVGVCWVHYWPDDSVRLLTRTQKQTEVMVVFPMQAFI